MKSIKKLLALLLALVMTVGLMAGCSGDDNGTTPDDGTQGNDSTNGGSVTAEGSRYGGHLNVRITVKPNGLDPLKQTGVWKYLYTTCVFENALTRDADNNIAPGVCDFELSEDQLTLKLWVREGMTFSNGDPVDIYDVEASIKRALSLYNNIKKYVTPYVTTEIEGDTMTITFSEYHEKCLYYLAAYQTWCAIMPKEICEKYATSFILDQIEDAIGTGPYIYSEFQDSVKICLTKRDNYVPVESDGTGFAGTKYGYMDSITFWYNDTDASAAMGVLAGDYDMVDVIPSEYKDMATAQGLKVEVLPSNQHTFIIFNTNGTSNVCAKYPSLRKAIMAAINYEEFLSVVCDGAQIMEGEMILGELYATDIFRNADYYGPANQEVVAKYLEAAKAEGYDGEAVQIVYNSSRSDIPTLLGQYMEDADINYEINTMESATYTAFVGDPSNSWDFTFQWAATATTPSLLQDGIIQTNFKSERKDEILEEMDSLDVTSEEYLAKWEELSQIIADECQIGVLSLIDWWWWCPETLHPNDEGVARYVYNTYWDDPANHTA